MRLERNFLGLRCEEFWFDARGYGESRAPVATLRSFEAEEACHCRISEATRIVSMAGSESDWAGSFSARTRASIKHAEKSCVIGLATMDSDRREFFVAHRAFARSAGLSAIRTAEESFLEIFLARDSSGALLHGCAFLRFPAIGLYRYRYGVAVVKSQANSALLFAAMRRAKSLGCEKFDLGGIVPDASPGSKEERINFFKEQFGGEIVPVYFHLRSGNPALRLGLRILRPVVTRRRGYRFLEKWAAALASNPAKEIQPAIG